MSDYLDMSDYLFVYTRSEVDTLQTLLWDGAKERWQAMDEAQKKLAFRHLQMMATDKGGEQLGDWEAERGGQLTEMEVNRFLEYHTKDIQADAPERGDYLFVNRSYEVDNRSYEVDSLGYLLWDEDSLLWGEAVERWQAMDKAQKKLAIKHLQIMAEERGGS